MAIWWQLLQLKAAVPKQQVLASSGDEAVSQRDLDAIIAQVPRLAGQSSP